MKEQQMYRKLAEYYDLIYHWKNYKDEVKIIESLVKKYKKSNGEDLLEVGCGTASHLKYFSRNYDCTAFDINKEMIEIARNKVKGVKFLVENMINFNLNKEFDIILCLFSSIGYAKTEKNLKKTLDNFAKHLKKGGVLIIEPWFTNEDYKVGHSGIDTYSRDGTNISRISFTEKNGNLSRITFHWTIGEENKGVRYFIDRHNLGLFDTELILKKMEKCGIKGKFMTRGFSPGRGLFIGVKR